MFRARPSLHSDRGKLVGLILGSVFIGLYTTVWISGGPDAVSGFYLRFGLSRKGIMEGEWWQWFTYSWLHGGWLHVISNSLGAAVVVPQVQRMLGSRGVVQNMVGGVLLGGLANVMVSSEQVLVGASGGITALMLLVTTLAPEARLKFVRLSAGNLGKGFMIASAVLLVLSPGLQLPLASRVGNSLESFFGPGLFQVAHACHLGGGFFGWAMARWILRPRPGLDQIKAARSKREGGLD